jgi:hypothetical protein
MSTGAAMGKALDDDEEGRETTRVRAGSARGGPDSLELLTRLQDADGSWDLTGELADAVGRPLEDLERAFAAVVDDLEGRARLVDRAGELAGQSLQAWATVRTQQQEQELANLLRSDLRDLGGPLASIAARIDEAQDAEQPSGGVLSTLEELLQFVVSFRSDVLRKDALRRAFATALALRWVRASFADPPSASSDAVEKGRAWLQTAPLSAAFWLERLNRSQLVR